MLENINILNELKEAGAIALIQADNKNYYAVPEGYFPNLASGIMANIFIESLPSANPYTVPDGYFDNLPEIILDKIDFSFLQQDTRQKNIYSVPDGYFNSFADNVLKKIKGQENEVQQELAEISPLLSKISKENVYSLPENYFEQLNPLAGRKQDQPTGKVISLAGKTRKWINYAAAACIAMILFGGGYFYISNNKNKPVDDAPVAATSKMDIQKQLEGLSDSEIEAYLKENGNMSVFTNVGMEDEQHQNIDIQTLINDIPDEEIQQYLNEDEPAKTEEGI